MRLKMTTTRIFSITTMTTLVVLLAAIYLHIGGVQIDDTTKSTTSKRLAIDKNINGGVEEDTKIFLILQNNFYYNNGKEPNIEDYVKLLEDLRRRLTGGTANGIAVTRSPTDIRLQERFLQVQLENGCGEVITVIIDTVNVYVVGYLVGPATRPTLYYLNKVPTALFQAFPMPDYNRIGLGFAGNYDSLPLRETHQIGHGALNDAVKNLYNNGDSRDSAVLVIIQMVSEAIRIRYIEHLIRRNMLRDNLNFIPDPRAISMENIWSKLSEQVQCSGESGVFLTEIDIRMLALMLYKPNPNTNIIGRDGQWVDVKDNQYNNGDPIILWACGNAQRNQLWTFKSDGTIRSNGKCLTTFSYASGNYIMIYDCDTAEREATKWSLYNAGTIMNRESGLANGANTHVSLENCVIGTEPRQQWALYGDNTIRPYSDRTVCVTSNDHESLASIILLECQGLGAQRWTFMADGTILYPTARLVMDVKNSDVSQNTRLKDLASTIERLSENNTQRDSREADHANGANARVWLANCVFGTEPRQQWTLNGDRSIRLYSDRTLSMTSDGHHYN
ncbi:ribosome-inactivating protein [Tanacetum coccineum]